MTQRWEKKKLRPPRPLGIRGYIKGSASHLWPTSPVIDLAAQLEHLADAGQLETVQLLWPQLLQTLADCGVAIVPTQPTIDVKHADLNC